MEQKKENPNGENLLLMVYKEVCELKEMVIKSYTPDEGYVDIETICRKLKISKKTLRRYRTQGLIPFSKIKGKVYFVESEVKQALKQHYYGG